MHITKSLHAILLFQNGLLCFRSIYMLQATSWLRFHVFYTRLSVFNL